MNRWDQDAARNQPGRLAGRLAALYASPSARKWIGLFLAWVFITGLLSAVHLTVLIWPIMLALIGYVVVYILRETPRGGGRMAAAATSRAGTQLQFNPAPGWPLPPRGWTPPRGWQPDPSWPPAPPGWEFWVPPPERGTSGRTSLPNRRNDDQRNDDRRDQYRRNDDQRNDDRRDQYRRDDDRRDQYRRNDDRRNDDRRNDDRRNDDRRDQYRRNDRRWD